MAKQTGIEWTDKTWSPWRGCTKVSAGCANCYAETLSKRAPAVLGQWGKGKPRVKNKNWQTVRAWNSLEPGARVFPSLCDWLDDEVPVEWLVEFLQLISETPDLVWQLLTKRPENWRPRIEAAAALAELTDLPGLAGWLAGEPPGNVWFGFSAENQETYEKRFSEMARIPAVVAWCSFEPLIGRIEVLPADFQILDWAVVGGESGHGARPCSLEWIADIRRKFGAEQVPVFVKQFGALAVSDNVNLYDFADSQKFGAWGDTAAGGHLILNDKKGGDLTEWPEEFRVRRMPL